MLDVSMSTSETVTPPVCTDIIGWVDQHEHGCDWYVQYENPANPGCPLYPNEAGIDANTACCYCDGGNVSTNTPTASVTTSTSPSVAPTAAVSKTDFALKFLSDDTIIDFNGTSSDKEIGIKTLISNKAPRDSFEQTILVGTDCQFKFDDEYPDDTTLVSISNDATLDEVEDKHIKVTSDVDIDTAVIASKGRHATDPDNKSIYSEYEENGKEMAKIEFCIRTD